MIEFRTTAHLDEDRTLVVTLPPGTPTGPVDVVVSVESRPAPASPKPERTSLADWAEAEAEDWGDRITSDDVEGFTGRRP